MTEWFKVSILKIVMKKFIIGSNPILPNFLKENTKYFIKNCLDSSVRLEHRVEDSCVIGSNPILDKKVFVIKVTKLSYE